MFKHQEKTQQKIEIINRLDDLKGAIQELDKMIKRNEGTITRWIYTICIAAVMAVAAIPAAYRFLGEDGLMLGVVFTIISFSMALGGYMQYQVVQDHNKELRNERKWSLHDRVQLFQKLDYLQSTPDWK